MKKTITEYFDGTVKKFPENTAVADTTSSFSYKELQLTAKKAGCALARRGIRKKPVAVLMSRGIKQPAAMLAVLYSGNFYAVLDPESPVQRLDKIIETLSPAAVIYDSSSAVTAGQLKKSVLKLDFDLIADEGEADSELIRNIGKHALSNDPAYALFTSGSTGVPKGAVLTNFNVISYIHWFIKCFDITEKTVFGSQTSLFFSMSVSDFYSCIFTGASYHIIPKEYFTFPAKLVEFLNIRKINTIYWVPSALGMAAKLDLFKYFIPETLEKVLFAGEVMPVKYLNYWRRYLPSAVYANLFGPTETTDICAYYKVNREFQDSEQLPIGIACDNCEIFIIDESGREVPDGETGELYIKSPFTAAGYFKSPEKTAEAFVQNPLHSDFPDIVYKTGDLARKNIFGELEYAGRRDFQIKHLGYRIEPNEIEAALGSVDGINVCVCVYDAENDKIILAYEGVKNSEKRLADAAVSMLPHYMRPAAFSRFSAFPVNASGKLDRKKIKKIILENK